MTTPDSLPVTHNPQSQPLQARAGRQYGSA